MNQSYLYCFDVDECLLTKEMDNESDYIKGIIKTEVLDQLEQQGHKVTIVSPSPFADKRYKDERHWIKDYVSNDDRWLNVKKAMSIYGYDKDHTILVDDLESNRNQVNKALGVKTLSPEEFLSSIEQIQS